MGFMWSRRSSSRVGLEGLDEVIGSRKHPLAFAHGSQGQLVGFAHAFAWRGEQGWQVMGYHEVTRGGWKTEDTTFWWEDQDGTHYAVTLDDPGRFPELFRERVTATIVVDQIVDHDGHQIRVIARRDLGQKSGELRWNASAMPGSRLSAKEFDRVVEEVINQVKFDYGIG